MRRRFGPTVMDGDALKTPLAQSLNRFAAGKAQDAIAGQALTLPCKVVDVISPWLVTVAFAVNAPPGNLPQVTIPVLSPSYVALPIQVGDAGLAIGASVELGQLSELGGGTPTLWDQPANLTPLAFYWLGKKSFTTPDPAAIVLQPMGKANFQLPPSGARIAGDNGNLFVAANLGAGNAVSTSLTTPAGQAVTLLNGITVEAVGVASGLSQWFTSVSGQVQAIGAEAQTIRSEANNLIAQANLQTLVNEAYGALGDLTTGIGVQLEYLAGFGGLLSFSPANLTDVINWVNDFIGGFLGPGYLAYAKLASQLTEITSALSSLTSLVNDTASGNDWTITIPPVTIPPVPPPSPPPPPAPPPPPSAPMTVVASEAIAAHSAVYVYSNGAAARVKNASGAVADPTDPAYAPCNGFVAAAVAMNGNAAVQLAEQYVLGFVGLSPGSTYWLDYATPGHISLTPPPSGGGHGSQSLGFADPTGTIFWFSPQPLQGI